ncbi:DNA polymerase III subunit alpha [Paenibacillus campi]|uniref:DNA polymerase III subunit alpha n=1 Tax=Paenibacillus campi TaxID=3106031 RepID=UPI002AFECF74|nr:DNA polymerase III subunit alpha [Paenibacillus sp. SGZ-1014]
MTPFVHLHVHSEYSLLDGAARIHDLVSQAAAAGMSSLALTDHGVMYGAIPFYKACLQHGMKPIIGCEVYYTAGSRREKATRKDQPIHHLLLLAKNETGYRNLMKLCSIGHLEGFHYKPRIDGDALRQYHEGIICLSACLGGEIPQHLLHGEPELAKQAAQRYVDIFGADFYIELQDHGLAEQKKVTPQLIALARELNIPLVATNDVHYLSEDDAKTQDVLICIGTGKTVDDESRLRIPTNQLYLKNGEQMATLFRHVPEAIHNTVRIAEQCQLTIPLGQSLLPSYHPLPDGLNAERYLEQLCREGLERRYSKGQLWHDAQERGKLEERLAYELSVIGSMGFADYFLIVWDFMSFAHRARITTGPGRGSSAGSLVAYVLEITNVDPIRYKLLFERFLNPDRVSMPDIDIDFSDLRRDEMIDYVVSKYGRDRVAQIITFGTLAARAAVRDVGRALAVPYADTDRAAKLIPAQIGVTIRRALEQVPELRERYEKSGTVRELIDTAIKVEGMPRHASTHAAGVVISSGPLTDVVPLQEGSEHAVLTQYAMESLEAIGMLKMDFLGLRTLSIIERCLEWIKEQTGETIDWDRVSYDDPLTYHMLSQGDTMGVFQLESVGIRRVLRDLKPSGFEDIVSVNALYRPGPMDFIPRYIDGKHGRAVVEYPHPDLQPILQDTYGIIVYQEQIMQIASLMAGFSLGEADLLRRAVSKKKREVLDQEREHFVSGSLQLGYTEHDANAVYDMIVRFADYGFPRAHATAYGVLAFQTAYLKAHYPVQFIASMLTAVMGTHRKVAEYVLECQRIGVEVLPPDIHLSGVNFTPVLDEASVVRTARNAEQAEQDSVHAASELMSNIEQVDLPTEQLAAAPSVSAQVTATKQANNDELRLDQGGGHIRFGLGAVKNVGTQAINSIIKERQERPFDSLVDFCRRVDPKACNKRVIESLIQAGAFDSLPGHRAQLLQMLDETIKEAAKWRKEREELQIEMFDFDLGEQPNWDVSYPDVPPFTAGEQLEFERELLGLYLSGHPLDDYEAAIEQSGLSRLMNLHEAADDTLVAVAGMVVSLKAITTKQGKSMAFMELEDQIEKCEVVMFPEIWRKCRELVDKGVLLIVRGRLQQEDESFKLVAEEVVPLTPSTATEMAAKVEQRAQALRSKKVTTSELDHAPAAAARTSTRTATNTRTRSAAGAVTNTDTGTQTESIPVAERTPKQHVYIKITREAQQAGRLEQLKQLLADHPGQLGTMLFYEESQKLLDLSESYRIKPSPGLFSAMEDMLGAGTVRVK